MKHKLLLGFLILVLAGLMGCHQQNRPSPFSESAINDLATFQIADGFQIELLASEPIIRDPVDMMIDEYGRMYVVEMTGVPFNKSGIGQVILVSDTNADGKMDKRTVFADSLILPSGIMRWKNGAIVSDPPNVYYFEDTDNDGRADIRQLLLTGFDTTNLEANVNNPEYGLDNWIYLADLPVGGRRMIHFGADSSTVQIPESTLRFRPELHQLEGLSGQTQFGQTFDVWGRHLLVNNSNHIFQNVIASRYLRRNPALTVTSAIETLADHKKVFPITRNPEYQMLTNIGVFTSACGIVSYLGGAFPEKYNDNAVFVCEPASNILHADFLVSNGVTDKAEPVFEKKEFLASTDAYSRMVNTYIGPDGALYVVDFYRQVIEGPEFMAKEVLDTVDLYNGTHKGRIYRISAKGSTAPEWTGGLNLGNATPETWVEKLADKNIWWRLNAQRLLVDRKDEQVVPALKKMAINEQSPMGRLHALWTLEGMDRLTPEIIIGALQDPEAGIRENAIQLAELHLNDSEVITTALMNLQDDPEAKVKLQLLLTLGMINTPQADKLRQQLLFNDIKNSWMQIAALSASSSNAIELLNVVLEKFDPANPAYASLVQRLGAIIGTSQESAIMHQFIQKATVKVTPQSHWQTPLLEGLAQGLKGRRDLPKGIEKSRSILIENCLDHPLDGVQRAALDMLQAIGLTGERSAFSAMQKALLTIKDTTVTDEQRALAISFLALQNPKPYEETLKSLINPQEPLQVQLASVNTLKQIPGTAVSQYFLSQWTSFSPGVRTAVVNVCLMTDERIKLLLDAIESGRVNLADINWVQSVRLRSLGNVSLRMRSRELFSKKDDQLKDVVQSYQSALSLKGDGGKGKMIFQENCAVCHQMGGKLGRAFGPDLGTVHAWAPADIMINILDPNRTVAYGYDTWEIVLHNATTIQGIITNETPTGITVSDANGKVSNIARQDIQSLRALGISAMPAGWEEKISKQQMADLLTFLKQGV